MVVPLCLLSSSPIERYVYVRFERLCWVLETLKARGFHSLSRYAIALLVAAEFDKAILEFLSPTQVKNHK
jgi:hypothetical protein